MITEELRALIRAPKFTPFTVHVTDGSSFHIHHPDYAWLTPNDAVLYVFEKNAGQRIVVSEVSRIATTSDAPLAT